MKLDLNASLRTDTGKGASRRLRHQALTPGIVYGAEKDPVSITLEARDLRANVDNETFYTSLINLNIDGNTEQVVVRDIQHHPYKIDVMHIDFQRIDDTHKLHMHIPLHFVGDEKAPGVKTQGGLVSHHMVEVEVECLAKNIPDYIEVDMSQMNVGDILHLTDLKLPEGVEIRALKMGGDHDTAVCSIHAPKGGAVEEGEAEEGGEE